MQKTIWILALIIILGAAFFFTQRDSSDTQTNGTVSDGADMTFFVTSRNPGTGANLGGIAGADALCQTLAEEADAGDKTWRAYLSTTATEDTEAVNAGDRIGNGPWHNAEGILIASSIEELHTDNNINKETGLDENGNQVNGRGDSPNIHDILTGSLPDGTASDATCDNWTSESSDGSATVGHHDRVGLDESDAAKSWNSSHGSRGCSLPDLNGTGGGGLLYCFAL